MAGLSASRRHHQCHAAVIDTTKAARASRMSHSSRRTQACPPAELRYWIRIDAIISVVGEFGRLSLPAPPSISSGLVGMVQTHKVKEHAVLCIGSSDLVHWNRNYPFRQVATATMVSLLLCSLAVPGYLLPQLMKSLFWESWSWGRFQTMAKRGPWTCPASGARV